MTELCSDARDAPVARLHTQPMTHPFAPALERAMLVGAPAIEGAARDLLAGVGRPTPPAAARAAAPPRARDPARPPPAPGPSPRPRRRGLGRGRRAPALARKGPRASR